MNTVRALECLAFTALSAPQLADRLQVSVRTARRLLKRLALEGFVIQERDHRRRYHATPRLAALGRQLLDHTPVVTAAAPRVAQLARDTSCTAHLWIPGYEGQLVCALHADTQPEHPTVCGFGTTRNLPPIASRAQVADLTAHRHANPATTQREHRRGRPDGSPGSGSPTVSDGELFPEDPAPVPWVDVRERLRERPPMPPRVLRPVLALAVHVIGRLIEDLRPLGSRALTVRRRILDSYKYRMCDFGGTWGYAIGADVAKNHRAVLPNRHLGPMILADLETFDETESLTQPAHSRTHIGIDEHRNRGRARNRSVPQHRGPAYEIHTAPLPRYKKT
jgi:hypothetical protein